MSRLYFRQLLSGRDFAKSDMSASHMRNFCYLVGDTETKECMIVDPAYAIGDLLSVIEEDEMNLVGVLATHYHADHIGGSMMGMNLDGIAELLEIATVPIHVQESEVVFVNKVTGVGGDDLVVHKGSDQIKVGEIDIDLIHCPGHSPGSQAFLVENHFIGGDTLFIDGCGRTDLPGGDGEALYETLTQRLSGVPDDAILYPGHFYSPQPCQSMELTRKHNAVLAPRTSTEWLAMFT